MTVMAAHPGLHPPRSSGDVIGDHCDILGRQLFQLLHNKWRLAQQFQVTRVLNLIFLLIARGKLTGQFHVALYSDGPVRTVREGSGDPDAVVDLTRPDNDAYLSYAFPLDKPMDLEIYGIGEYYSSDDIMVDWGWVIDARTRLPRIDYLLDRAAGQIFDGTTVEDALAN